MGFKPHAPLVKGQAVATQIPHRHRHISQAPNIVNMKAKTKVTPGPLLKKHHLSETFTG